MPSFIRTATVETLGCKVNQYESSYLLEMLQKAGYRITSFDKKADLYVVNSCAVTKKACYQTRQLLRRAQRNNPGALVVAAGCDAQLEPERLAEDRLATHILGSVDKLNLLDWIEFPGSFEYPFVQVSDSRKQTAIRDIPVSRMLGERTRAFLKIQDGCDSFCTYCVVPWTRGCSRSLEKSAIRTQLDRLLAAGYQEVILTGIHLGQWGRDLDPRENLVDLLNFLHAGRLPCRLRLSSLEPKEWSRALIERLLQWPGLCPHFHIPLQSGDRDMLKRMGRPYSPQEYEALLMELHRTFPEASLGADVMVGFPGEEDHHFNNTVNLIEKLPLSYLHVFPFSPRPKTPAAAWPQRATGAILKQRAAVLREISARKRRAFQERFVGRWLEVLIEARDDENLWRGTSRNYLQVRIIPHISLTAGSIVRVRVREIIKQGLIATVDSEICAHPHHFAANIK